MINSGTSRGGGCWWGPGPAPRRSRTVSLSGLMVLLSRRPQLDGLAYVGAVAAAGRQLGVTTGRCVVPRVAPTGLGAVVVVGAAAGHRVQQVAGPEAREQLNGTVVLA